MMKNIPRMLDSASKALGHVFHKQSSNFHAFHKKSCMISLGLYSSFAIRNLLATPTFLQKAGKSDGSYEYPQPKTSDTSDDVLEDIASEEVPLPEFAPINPAGTSVLLFPGQGAQFVGMAKKLLPYPNVVKMFDHANEVLGYDLLELCLNGPKRKLDMTEYCQPAIFVTSLAAVERLQEENPKAVENCVAAAGFSVGEYAALVFADAISFEDGLQLIKVRAKAMQHASLKVPSGMMSCFESHDARIRFATELACNYCSEKLDIEEPVCTVATYLYPECKVVAGHAEALDFVEENKRDFGIIRTKRLPVSGAFHTSLMLPAKASLKQALARVPIQKPLITVYSNLTGGKHSTVPDRIRVSLEKQLHKPVKWEQIMHSMLTRKQGESFPSIFELGPGKQLGTLLRLVNMKAYKNYKNVEV